MDQVQRKERNPDKYRAREDQDKERAYCADIEV